MKQQKQKAQRRRTIFYSWQSDDNQTRKHIEECLKRAIKRLKNDAMLDYRPILDDSTKGKMGAINIPDTISEKIDACDVFVADLSFIGKYKRRRLVNQNVIYELGYMIGRRTDTRVIILFNTDSGKIKDLPFDISYRRVMSFSIREDRNGEQLTNNLSNLISAYLQNADLLEKIPKENELNLDDEELEIMKLFKSLGDEKHIFIIRTLDGEHIRPASKDYDAKILANIERNQEGRKLLANLDSLVDKNYLERTIGGDGRTFHYKLKKPGYNIIEKI